jgi:1-aminocyclopropane-1-carboxylate deaminase/D-cysteine desulfhydrase-like pyridoxal-dependent ACC family enzyme
VLGSVSSTPPTIVRTQSKLGRAFENLDKVLLVAVPVSTEAGTAVRVYLAADDIQLVGFQVQNSS